MARRKCSPAAADRAPERFTIVPDDYHVPYAGTAEDGRRFFLSEELFGYRPDQRAATSYVGLFLWYDDGTYSINIEPGDFIAYYAPWDGIDYDT